MSTVGAEGTLFHIFFREAEVDDEEEVGVGVDAEKEVVGVDIAMDDAAFVQELDPFDHLVADH